MRVKKRTKFSSRKTSYSHRFATINNTHVKAGGSGKLYSKNKKYTTTAASTGTYPGYAKGAPPRGLYSTKRTIDTTHNVNVKKSAAIAVGGVAAYQGYKYLKKRNSVNSPANSRNTASEVRTGSRVGRRR